MTAEKQGDPCDDRMCQFNPTGVCMYGLRYLDCARKEHMRAVENAICGMTSGDR